MVLAEMHPCSWSRGGYATVPRRGRASSKHLSSTGDGKPTGIWLAKTSGHSGGVTWLPVYNAVGLCQLWHIPLWGTVCPALLTTAWSPAPWQAQKVNKDFIHLPDPLDSEIWSPPYTVTANESLSPISVPFLLTPLSKLAS